LKEKGIIILIVLALMGVGLAFVFVGLMVSVEPRTEDAWIYQKPAPAEKNPMLTEDRRLTVIEIAKQNETVKQYLEQGYEIGGGSVSFGPVSENEPEIASDFITLRKDNESIIVNVDLNEGKVIGIIYKSSGRLVGLEMQEGGEIKVINKTGLQITIGDRNGKLIKAQNVRDLTKEEREKARAIALSDPEVRNIIEREKYDIEIKSTGIIITNEAGEVETKFSGASVTFKLEDGTVYFVHVDLAKEKVIRVSPPIYRKER
jgi:ribosomal protein L6P/L9E